MKIGLVGATGQVGAAMRAILAERRFPVDEMRYFASSRSAGTTLPWNGAEITVEDAALADPSGLDVVPHVAGLEEVVVFRSPDRPPFAVPGVRERTFEGINRSHWWLVARVA